MFMKTKDKVKMSRSLGGKKPLTRLATLATLPDFWGPMVRSESDQKSDSPGKRAVDGCRSQYTKIVGTNSKKSLKTKEDASYRVLNRTQNEPYFGHRMREPNPFPRQFSGFLLPN
jgi:hypothetical protein